MSGTTDAGTPTPTPTPTPAAGSVPAASAAPGTPSHAIDVQKITELAQKEANARAEVDRLTKALEEAAGKAKGLEEQIAERDKKAAEAEAARVASTAKGAVIEAAKKLRAHDPESVLALLPQDAVTAAGNGESEALTKALDALVKEKPWLFRPDGSRDPGAKPPPNGGETPDAMKMKPDEYKAAREAYLKGSR